jgi:hypothetical protein
MHRLSKMWRTLQDDVANLPEQDHTDQQRWADAAPPLPPSVET